MSWWLIGDDGVRRRLGPRGLVLGRGDDCDLILTDPKASAIHAALMVTSRGPVLRGFGRNPTLVDGRPVTGAILQEGASISLPGAHYRLGRGDPDPPSWLLQWGPQRFGLRGGPLLVGSSPAVDLLLPGWPAEAFALTVAQGALVIELLAPLLLDGCERQPGVVHTLSAGDHIGWQGEDLVVRSAGAGQSPDSSPKPPATMPPHSVRLHHDPAGGHLLLGFASQRQVQLDLPPLQSRLLALLLQPPGAYVAGERVPDALMISRLWPKEPQRTRPDLDAVVHRTRKQLLAAGLDPSGVLMRDPAQDGTAFKLASDSHVTVAWHR